MNTDDPEDRPARHPNRDDEADGLGGKQESAAGTIQRRFLH